jgi:hypothetical protein
VNDTRRLLIAASLVCSLLLAVIVASGALAGPRLKTKSATADAGLNERGTATATCKRGTKAVSGGFESEYDIGGFTPVFNPDEASRTGGREWTFAAANRGMEGLLTSYAYCRDEKVKSRTQTASVDSGETETVQATCKPGTKALSGGFDAEPVDDFSDPTVSFYVLASQKVGARGWAIQAQNAGDETGQLTAQVNCREGKGLKTADVVASEGGLETIEASCKRRERAVSGGFGGGEFPFFSAYASMKTGKRTWRLFGQLREGVTVYAYCEKK